MSSTKVHTAGPIRRTIRNYTGILLFMFVLQHVASAQTDTTVSFVTPPSSANKAFVGFDKLMNRYQWNAGIFYANTFGPISLLLNQRFLSSLIRTEQTYTRDENTLDLDMKHDIVDGYKGILRANVYTLSDDQNVALGKAGSQALRYGVEMTPLEHVRLSPMLGIRYDNQLDRRDKGAIYSVGIHSRGLETGGYDVSINGDNEQAHLSPRKLETFRDTIGLRKIFYDRTQVQFALSYFRNRRDFYLGAGPALLSTISSLPDIETRAENAFMVNSEFDYAPGTAWQLVVHALILSHDVSRKIQSSSVNSSISPNMNELRLGGDALVNYSPGNSFSMSAGISAMSREEEDGISVDGTVRESSIDSALRIQERKNNQSLRTSLMLDMTFIPSYSDTFRLSLSNSLMRYDTPSLENNDDRDELRHLLLLRTSHRINQYLHAGITAEVSLNHLVYLSGLRSSENAWNRIFRLAPRLTYMPSKKILTVNTFEVLANYTVYDFEYLSSTIRSFTFRQFAWVDSSIFSLTGKLAIAWWNNVRFYERGELQWSDFSERPRTFIDERTYNGAVQYRVSEFLFFSIGIRYFSQTRFTYSGAEKQEDSFLRSVGPITAFDWSVGSRTHLVVKGWYESLLQTNQPKRTNANMTMECSVRL